MNILDALTRDCFNSIIALRDATCTHPDEAAAAQQQMREALDRMMGRAFASGVPHGDVYASVYALTALADSLAVRDKGDLGTYWRDHLLQSHYFNEASEVNEHEGFFERLDRARHAGRGGVIQVYATCLALGFRGRLRTQDAERAQTQLQNMVAPSNWKNGETAVLFSPRETRPWQQPHWLVLAALLLGVGLYTILSSSMRGAAAALAGYIDTLLSSS